MQRAQVKEQNNHSIHTNGHSNGPSNGIAGHKTNGLTNGSTPHGEKYTRQKGPFETFFHFTFVPLALMTCIPNLVVVVWYTVMKCSGSYLLMLQTLGKHGNFIGNLIQLWIEVFRSLSADVWYIFLGYCLFAVVLMMIVPGERAEGPLTQKGNTPVYKDNGFRCYLVTLLCFGLLTYYLKSHGLSPTLVYDKFERFLMVTNIAGHCICTFLLLKGLTRPSSTDSGSSGNLLFDYYWGTELYPRVFGIDIKVFTNCRFGMTVWPLLVLIFAIKSYELHGFVDSMWVSCFLQMLYITKFFWWEAGYYRTIDISVDRAGYMLCWGCLTYIPGVYALCSLYLVSNPVHLGPFLSVAILTAGSMSIGLNYWADYQRQVVRSTGGKCTIWGRTPEVIHAKYWVQHEDGRYDGQPKNSILLVSGFWSMARHFNYVPEIALAFFWSLPGLFENLMIYSYVIYLTILLIHR